MAERTFAVSSFGLLCFGLLQWLDEVAEFFEEWMTEVAEEHSEAIDPLAYVSLIETARDKAIENKSRRMQPSQIVRAAFYDFILTKANPAFVESFRYLQNQKVAAIG